MATFVYKALDGGSRFVSGELRADSMNAAWKQLVELGYTPLSTVPAGSEKPSLWQALTQRSRVSKRDVTILLQDLALLLRSGLPLDDGLRLLVEDASTGTGRLITQLRKAIGGGANFAEALQSQTATALPELIAVVRSAEATGNLEHALESIAQERTKQEKVNARVRSAIRYPIFLLLVSMAVLLFFLLFVVPQFAEVIRDFGNGPEGLVRVVIGISDGLRNNGGVISFLAVLLCAFGVLVWRLPQLRNRVLAPLGRLPLVRGVLVLRRTAMFCRSLGTLLTNGVDLSDALRLMSENGVVGERLRVVADSVRRGERLVDSLTETKFIPPLATRMLRVGEESGSLGMVAARCADYYEAKLADQIDKITGIIGPAAIVFIASIIGTLIVSIMSTLLSINQMVM